jgi:hypothetical protein
MKNNKFEKRGYKFEVRSEKRAEGALDGAISNGQERKC